jgi:exosortase/archaeosortase family protein
VVLVCAIPWPGLVYSWIAGPLQTMAARAAVVVMRFTGVDAIRSGTKMLMMVPDALTGQEQVRVLNVAEACAGLRSLMTFITVAAAVAFLSARPLWQKIVITVSAIPIAIFCNVMRVAGQGLLDRYWSQELAEGFAHQFVGLVMMIPAFLLILLVCWLLDHLFLDEVDEQERQRLRMGAAAGGGGERKVVQIQRPAAAVAGASAGAGARAGVGAARAPVVVPPARPSGFPRAVGGAPVARPAPQSPAQPIAKPQAARPATGQPGQTQQAPPAPKPVQAPKTPSPPQQAPQQGRQQK